MLSFNISLGLSPHQQAQAIETQNPFRKVDQIFFLFHKLIWFLILCRSKALKNITALFFLAHPPLTPGQPLVSNFLASVRGAGTS